MVFLLLLSCSNVPKHCQLAKDMMSSYANEVRMSDDLRVIASGGSMMGDIKQISFDFATVKKLDVSSARILYIKTIQKLINRLNNDPLLKSYLHNYPSDISNTEVSISFYESNAKPVGNNYVALVYMINNKIYYRSWNEDFKRLHEETYEEALQKVCGK